ncbi:Homeobox protein knotted-1-like 7 [Neolecta irregularis DAH-3]|uniref:Homeobox protein knotted-1-like 7 n=1 Tax=Neolecta irregularis (strain DAH-3) TaxID=1198029 RepID=A0A1U7LHX4_NEOID|nr:Homeobox protein knotted-1-like 7 [Neolecta irregularis DAH-3]|eukprot:OLL22255.1 Homeobox protein knotted-1-like 7 [Neolecta irregularis DAH-3]
MNADQPINPHQISDLLNRRRILVSMLESVIQIRQELLHKYEHANIARSARMIMEVVRDIRNLERQREFDNPEGCLAAGINQVARQLVDICMTRQRLQDSSHRISRTLTKELRPRVPDKSIKKASSSSKYSANSTRILKNWFLQHVEHPYPTENEKFELCRQTGLRLNQLNMWFTNARRRSQGGAKFRKEVVSEKLLPLVSQN